MDTNMSAHKTLKYIKVLIPIVAIGILFTTVTFAITIATLIKVNKGFDEIQDDSISPTTAPTVQTNTPITTTNTPITTTNTPSPNVTLATFVRIDDVMSHLNELQRIATANNGTRAVTTSGFNQTLDYIVNSLALNTDYTVSKRFFPIRQFALASDPVLISAINGAIQTYTYSTDLSAADFYYIQFSIGANFTDFIDLTAIPNVGCTDADWQNANPSPAGRVALVKRGICGFPDKGILAAKYNVSGLLIYNDGETPDRVSPIAISLGQGNYLPALFLSFRVGQLLANAAQNTSTNAGIRLIINIQDLPLSPIGNICADTLTGDATQTIVIGSHSDSVPAGPGINDNGSGSAANLGLAIALARLFQTSTYAKYNYRVRFCWWGAEEIGLLGSDYHVKQAKNSTVVGERLADYLINLNYDMLGSPNFMFGIYDGKTANNNTPANALPGSNKITALFQSWFTQQNLPWDYTDFSGRSDYGPFLAEGIVAGGLFSGADGVKSQAERDRYDQILGQGMGGIAGAIHDPCYHQACDSIQNINTFALDKMVQAAAYVLEYLARQDSLREFLYPENSPNSSTTITITTDPLTTTTTTTDPLTTTTTTTDPPTTTTTTTDPPTTTTTTPDPPTTTTTTADTTTTTTTDPLTTEI